MKTKGVSPFLATILIVAFTVAVGGILGSWLINFSGTQASNVGQQGGLTITCTNGGISLSDLKYHCPKLSGKVKNTGKIDLGNITLQIIYTNTSGEKICMSYAGGTVVSATCPGNMSIAMGEEYGFNLTIGGSNYDKIRVYGNCTSDVSYEAKSSDVTYNC
jgi:hypothetical protein